MAINLPNTPATPTQPMLPGLVPHLPGLDIPHYPTQYHGFTAQGWTPTGNYGGWVPGSNSAPFKPFYSQQDQRVIQAPPVWQTYNEQHAAPSPGHRWAQDGKGNWIPTPINSDSTFFNSPGMDNLYEKAVMAGLLYGGGSAVAGLGSGAGAAGAAGAADTGSGSMAMSSGFGGGGPLVDAGIDAGGAAGAASGGGTGFGDLAGTDLGGASAGFGPGGAIAGGSYVPSAAGGAGAAGTAAAGSMPAWETALIKAGGGLGLDALFGGATGAENRLSSTANAGFSSPDVQKFLPPGLQGSGPEIQAGLKQIADLLANPGSLSPTVLQAILPRLAQESQSIASNYRGIQEENAGAAARSNAPTSIKNAVRAATGIAEERAQREARNQALTSSDVLRRQDIGQTYNLLDTIAQFINSGRGAALQGQSIAAQEAARRQAAIQALFASILQGIGTNTPHPAAA